MNINKREININEQQNNQIKFISQEMILYDQLSSEYQDSQSDTTTTNNNNCNYNNNNNEFKQDSITYDKEQLDEVSENDNDTLQRVEEKEHKYLNKPQSSTSFKLDNQNIIHKFQEEIPNNERQLKNINDNNISISPFNNTIFKFNDDIENRQKINNNLSSFGDKQIQFFNDKCKIINIFDDNKHKNSLRKDAIQQNNFFDDQQTQNNKFEDVYKSNSIIEDGKNHRICSFVDEQEEEKENEDERDKNQNKKKNKHKVEMIIPQNKIKHDQINKLNLIFKQGSYLSEENESMEGDEEEKKTKDEIDLKKKISINFTKSIGTQKAQQTNKTLENQPALKSNLVNNGMLFRKQLSSSTQVIRKKVSLCNENIVVNNNNDNYLRKQSTRKLIIPRCARGDNVIESDIQLKNNPSLVRATTKSKTGIGKSKSVMEKVSSLQKLQLPKQKTVCQNVKENSSVKMQEQQNQLLIQILQNLQSKNKAKQQKIASFQNIDQFAFNTNDNHNIEFIDHNNDNIYSDNEDKNNIFFNQKYYHKQSIHFNLNKRISLNQIDLFFFEFDFMKEYKKYFPHNNATVVCQQQKHYAEIKRRQYLKPPQSKFKQQEDNDRHSILNSLKMPLQDLNNLKHKQTHLDFNMY